MKSSIRIGDCLYMFKETYGLEADERKRAVKEKILEELRTAIRRAGKEHTNGGGKIVVHVRPRRFQLYSRLQVFKEVSEGEYRLELPYESWIRSNRNLSRNELFVAIE